MKDEIYSKEKSCKVLKTDTHKGVRFYITTIGFHPCAYVECSKEFIDNHTSEYGDIEGITVHGGVTFTGHLLNLRTFHEKRCYDGKFILHGVDGDVIDLREKYAFGWDYGHCNDWEGYYTDAENTMWEHKKWTVQEIEQECRNAIDQYLDLMKSDEKKSSTLDLAVESMCKIGG